MTTLYCVNFTMANTEDLRQIFRLTDENGAEVALEDAELAMRFEDADGGTALSPSTANGGISINVDEPGVFEIFVPASQIGTLPPGVYQHDLLLTRSLHKQRLFKGSLSIERGISE